MSTRPSYAAMAQHASFEHERLKLSDRSVRLFQVHRGKEHEPISLRMTQFSAHRRPKYKAISYTWGNSDNPKQILVNGKAFLLHMNLWNLLYHLRLSDETSFLWADALCINQFNLRERNFHVQLMGRIYQNAESVIVWLGLPSPDRTEIRAFDFVKEISSYRKAHSDRMAIDTYLHNDLLHRWETLCRLTDHYYWHRTWIIQEFLFAPAIEVFNGRYKLDWGQFEELIDFMRREPDLSSSPTIARILQSRTARLTFRRRAGSKSTLHELLQEYSDSTCTERRDKIYGILGLAADCSEDGETGEALGVKADYEKHIVEVYLDALDLIKRSLPSDAVAPAAAMLLLRALHITSHDIAEYTLGVAATTIIPYPADYQLTATPEYISPIITIIPWVSIRDLQRRLELYNWGEHIGFEMHRIPSKSLLLPSKAKLRRHSSGSKIIHAALPPDFITTAVEAANLCTDLAHLHNYPSHHDLVLPVEHIAQHLEDKRLFDNQDLRKPPLILEQRPGGEILRLGFACTNAQRGDLIVQFSGLDTTLVVRQTGHLSTLVGKAMMVKNSGVLHEERIDPICDASIWTSHCWAKHNPDMLTLDSDSLSLAELLSKR